MAEATVLERYTTVLTPMKQEFIRLEAPTTGDTAQTRLANCKYVMVNYADTTAAVAVPSASVNAATKTITLGTVDGTNDVVIICIGY
jgi:hypothetical protein